MTVLYTKKHTDIHPLIWLSQTNSEESVDSTEKIKKITFGRVFPEEFFVIDEKNSCIADFFVNTYNGTETIYIKGQRFYKGSHYIFLDHYDTAVIEGDCFLLGGANNYYHFVFDCLPRLRFLEEHYEHILVDQYVLTSDTYHKAFLELLDIPFDKLLGLERGSTYLCRELTVVSHRIDTNLGGPVAESIDSLMWLRETILGQLDFLMPFYTTENNSRKYFISRTKQAKDRWRIDNLPEIELVFSDFGYEICHIEEMALLDQIMLFSTAKVIAGPHGAGFANTLFSQPDTTLIELGPISPHYWGETAKYLGQKHLFLDSEDSTHWQIDRIRAFLNQID